MLELWLPAVPLLVSEEPLHVPVILWIPLSLDFIRGLLKSNNCDANPIEMDCLTHVAVYIPTREDITYEQVECLYFDDVFWPYGLSDSVFFNIGTQFTW